MTELQQSTYRIRKLIGFLGISLPLALPLLASNMIVSSISHYYYLTAPSLYFIIVLSSLALFLISYKGHPIETDEFINDDWLTNLAGFAALLVVLIPTACNDSGNATINEICSSCNLPLFGHLNDLTSTYHFVAAGVFVFLMGWMSFFKFSRGQDRTSWQYKLYKTCGLITWLAISLLIIYFLSDFKINNFVFWMETLAILPFGLSWLVKGETIKDIKAMHKKMFG